MERRRKKSQQQQNIRKTQWANAVNFWLFIIESKKKKNKNKRTNKENSSVMCNWFYNINIYIFHWHYCLRRPRLSIVFFLLKCFRFPFFFSTNENENFENWSCTYRSLQPLKETLLDIRWFWLKWVSKKRKKNYKSNTFHKLFGWKFSLFLICFIIVCWLIPRI